MKRADVVAALHDGMTAGILEFNEWTRGEYLGDWGVESVLTTACARSLAARAQSLSSSKALTLEQTFQGIMDYSNRKGTPGHPTAAAKRIADKSTGRVDIVLWNANVTPRAIIEIKRSAKVGGLLTDAQRVIDFIIHAGAAYSGSVRYGLVATVVSGSARRGAAHILARAEKRKDEMARVAKAAKMKFKSDGPVWVGDAEIGDGQLACTYVFVFSRRSR